MKYNFEIIGEATSNGRHHFDLIIEEQPGVFVQATYWGNTTPKEVTAIKHVVKDDIEYRNVDIQKHVSRDRDTGKFTGKPRRSVLAQT